MSFARAAKCLIEQETRKIISENPLFVRARNGLLEESELVQHLSNLRYLFQQSGVYFLKAESRARELGQSELAALFLEKLKEEAGHDKWAEDDLASLNVLPSVDAREMVTPATLEVLELIDSIIRDDPRLLVGYMLFAEYFTVLAAPEFIMCLSKCGIKKESVSAISKHQEADESHVEEDLQMVERFITDRSVGEKLLMTIKKSCEQISWCLASSCNLAKDEASA